MSNILKIIYLLSPNYRHITAWLFELSGGALVDYENNCIPKSQREASFNIVALHQWEMGETDVRCKTSAEEWISGTLLPVSCGGPVPTVSHSCLSTSIAANLIIAI